MRKIVLTFGVIAGVMLSVMMLLTLPFIHRIGFTRGLIVGYTTMVLAFLMVYFGIRSYRDNIAGGSVTFGRAFVVGLLITAIACVFYVATWELIFYKLDPEFGDRFTAEAIENAKKSGGSDAEIAARIKEANDFNVSYKNPLVNIAYTLIEPLPVGILFTLVAAAVLSRKRRSAIGAVA
jgi:hypothetical protein